jgi:serine protease Do
LQNIGIDTNPKFSITMKTLKQAAFLFIAAFLGGIISLIIYNAVAGNSQADVDPIENQHVRQASYEIKNITVPTFDFADVSESVTSAVVHIKVTANPTSRRPENQPLPFDFFGDRFRDFGPSQGSGSGVIITNDGYIVTNNHVVDRADKIEVVLNDRRSFSAEVIGKDPNTDLALIKIKAVDLAVIPYGNSDNVRVGEWVLAVGNPFNLTSTVTAGIVSAKGRNINLLGGGSAIESFIQTDAAVNPGNSGGALVNTKGELVGINTAIASTTGQFSGYSFAVPVNIVRKVVEDLSKYGTVQRGFIGVSIRDVDAEIAKQEGLDKVRGVFIMELTQGGAAADAGIKKGDVIISVNGISVNTVPELQEIISSFRPGDKVKVTYIREKKERTTEIVLRNQQGSTSLVRNESAEFRSRLGAEFEIASSEILKKHNLQNGVVVKNLKKGILRDGGIPDGFIITHINKKRVGTATEVLTALKGTDGGVLIEGINPNGSRGVYGLSLE